jgi:hypothetical protein
LAPEHHNQPGFRVMIKKARPRTFDEIVSRLRSLSFDVRETPEGASRATSVLVTKHGCGAVLGRVRDGKGLDGNGVVMVHKPGVLLGGEIAILLDRGFQKFFKTGSLEIPATADRLRSEHLFHEELDQVTGEIDLYNESLGSVTDEYMYDRVKGRDFDAPAKGLAPWEPAGGESSNH